VRSSWLLGTVCACMSSEKGWWQSLIRLTELRRQGHFVELRIEGQLTGESPTVLEGELSRYEMEGVRAVDLACDGLTSVSPRIADDLKWPEGLRVRFVTSRPAQFELLTGYGVDAALDR